MTLRKIAALGAVAVGVAGGLGAQQPEPRAIVQRADSLLADLVDRGLFQGAVVIANGDRVSFARGFGFSDRERAVPFTPDTPTDAASLAKTFTAAGLLLLASEGRIDLDAPVQSVLAEYPHATTSVRHLLSHSAGLPDYEWFDTRLPASEPRTNAGQLAVVAREQPTPRFPPGTRFSYDNLAYDVAAMLIERVTAGTYAEFVAARFSGPLGVEAFVRPARFSDWPGVRTRGYRRTSAGWVDHDAYDLEGFYGADNIYLSASALQRWVAGYPQLVGPSVLRLATTRGRLDDGRTTGITLGSWYVAPDGARRYYTGHHNGFYSVAYADDARGISLAWVANDAPPPWLQVALTRALVALAEGGDPEALQPPRVDDVADPSGLYEVPEVGAVRVESREQLLEVEHGGVRFEAFPVAKGVRYVPGLDVYLRFAPNAAGAIVLEWDSVYQRARGTRR